MNEEEGGYLYTEVTSGMTQEQNNIAEILLEISCWDYNQ